MALQGTCSITTKVETGNTTTTTITNPEGVVEEIEIAETEDQVTEYEDAYVIVKQIDFFQTYIDGKEQIVHYHVAGYLTPDHRNDDQEDFLFFTTFQLPDYDYNQNILSQCYDHLKTINGFENLVNIN